MVPATAVLLDEGTKTDCFFTVAALDLTIELYFMLLWTPLTKLDEPLAPPFSAPMPRVVVFLKLAVLLPMGL